MELRHTAAGEGTLLHLLRGEMGLSNALVNRVKWNGRILVNGAARHTNFPVRAGDEVCVLLDEGAPDYPAEERALSILYEDDCFLAVDKPAGMLVHPSHACNSGTLANAVAFYYRATGQSCAVHPVTRLDRDTYGVVLLAKNAHIHAQMNQLHARGGIEKRYHALVYGAPPLSHGVIDAPIARKALPSLLREIRADGKPARTEYSLLSRAAQSSKLLLRPVTGRTHQLRLHCAYMGFPILGDPQYASEASRAFSQRLGLERQVLCAKSLTFPHPVGGEVVTIVSHMEAELPFARDC